MTWPELMGWLLQCLLWSQLVVRYGTPRMIAYLTASSYPPEDDEGEEQLNPAEVRQRLRALVLMAQTLDFEVTHFTRTETEGHNAGKTLTGITIATTIKEN